MNYEERKFKIHTEDFDWNNRTQEEKIIIIKEFGKFIKNIRKKVSGI